MKDRVRISLTLRPEIVNLLDNKIDGTTIRNRSHAVETYLKQILTAPVSQAIIMIRDQKMALLEICGETVLEKMLKKLKKASINKILISCQEKTEKLEKYLSKKAFLDFKFKFIQNNSGGNATALFQCQNMLEPGPFMLIYGDIMADIDIYDFGDFHKSNSGISTMVITSIADPLPWGMVRVKRNRILEFYEKPDVNAQKKLRLTNLINAGIYVFEPEIFSYINKRTHDLETQVIPKLIEEKKLYAYLLDGAWFNVSRPELLNHALKFCNPKKYNKK
jgi:NDP-sugar pyrophosphorylase family protein